MKLNGHGYFRFAAQHVHMQWCPASACTENHISVISQSMRLLFGIENKRPWNSVGAPGNQFLLGPIVEMRKQFYK